MQKCALHATGLSIVLAMAVPSGAQTLSAMPQHAVPQASVQYFAGGIGLDQRNEMRGLAVSHNLLVKFAEANGDYVVPDNVVVRKGEVVVLRVAQAGPLLYVNLPNGAYTVAASYKGMVRSQSVQVAGRAPDVVLRWPVQLN